MRNVINPSLAFRTVLVATFAFGIANAQQRGQQAQSQMEVRNETVGIAS